MAQAIEGVRLLVRGDEIWLEFTASDGLIAALNVSQIAWRRRGRIAESALRLWCEDRLLDDTVKLGAG